MRCDWQWPGRSDWFTVSRWLAIFRIQAQLQQWAWASLLAFPFLPQRQITFQSSSRGLASLVVMGTVSFTKATQKWWLLNWKPGRHAACQPGINTGSLPCWKLGEMQRWEVLTFLEVKWKCCIRVEVVPFLFCPHATVDELWIAIAITNCSVGPGRFGGRWLNRNTLGSLIHSWLQTYFAVSLGYLSWPPSLTCFLGFSLPVENLSWLISLDSLHFFFHSWPWDLFLPQFPGDMITRQHWILLRWAAYGFDWHWLWNHDHIRLVNIHHFRLRQSGIFSLWSKFSGSAP